MIEELAYSRPRQNFFIDMIDDLQNDIQKPDLYYDEANQLKSSKKQQKQLKFIKQLKARDIKLSYSHKKFQLYPSKVGSPLKNISSIQNEKQVLQDDISIAAKNFPSEELKQSSKYRHNYLVQKQRQKQKIPVQVITSFNPQNLISKQASIFIHEKLNKKAKNSQLQSSINSRIRQSRSQKKRQKQYTNSNNMQINNYKNYMHDNQGNIFQNLDLIGKQNSHHSLDKYAQLNLNLAPNSNVKIQEKLHLPSLANQGTKIIRTKIIQNQPFQNIQGIENERQYTLAQNCLLTQKSSPYIQKLVKIPIDRLKPLKPQQIKLKYQKKVKQQQKNRAKQIALHIFEKQQQEAQKMRNNQVSDLQSDENTCIQSESKRFANEELKQFRNKTSIIKKQKLLTNHNKQENIFKKHLMSFNSNAQF